MNKQSRRPLANISTFGVTSLQRQSPIIVAWWSAVFPGFGQYLLNQYIRGTLFTLAEVFLNTLSHVNEAIIYSFCGKFEMARSVIDTRWVFGYLPIYFYGIWASYRSAVVQNKMCELAEYENEPLSNNRIHPLEIQYLEQKSPFTSAVYSLFLPGLGQVYNHRIGLGFYAMFWWWVYVALSYAYKSAFYLIMGDLQRSISVLHPHWFLFLPSVVGGSIYHAFKTAISHNQLFVTEQRQHLMKRYKNSEVCIFNSGAL